MDTKQLITAAVNSDIRTFKDGMQRMIDQRIIEKISAIKSRTIEQMGFKLIKEMQCDDQQDEDEPVEQQDEPAEQPNNIVRTRRARRARMMQD